MVKNNRNMFVMFLFIGLIILISRIFIPRMQFLIVSIVLPLVGMVLRPVKSAGWVGIFFGIKWFLFGVMPATFGIPTVCAAANWSLYAQQDHKTSFMKFVLNVLLPLICMLLFVLHPIGCKAFLYSLYWLIPIGAYFLHYFFRRSVFFVALGSTFIAHAVGSVLWLYLVPMSPERWIALIPVVAIERLLFAAGGVFAYQAIKYFRWCFRNAQVTRVSAPTN